MYSAVYRIAWSNPRTLRWYLYMESITFPIEEKLQTPPDSQNQNCKLKYVSCAYIRFEILKDMKFREIWYHNGQTGKGLN